MQPALQNLLRSAARIILTVLAIVFAFGFFAWVLADSRQKVMDRMNRAELAELFAAAASDGTVPHPPRPATNFVITSRHGGEPYIIAYTNASSQRAGYFTHHSSPGQWTFRELSQKSPHTFTREKNTNR